MKNPLAEIAEILEKDMTAVDNLIRKRMQSKVPLIPKLADHLIAAGGKRIRPLMTLASAAIYKSDMKRAHTLAAAVEFIHSATLLHDDVVDESAERRGKKTANIVFGNHASVLVGDYLFSRAFQLMTEIDSMEVLRILSGASAIIAEGEVKQLTHKGDLKTNMDDYITIIKSKTAALFAAASQIGPALSGAGNQAAQDMYDYGINLGIAFQIADDALDYVSDSKTLGKTIGDDFREGKLTAPILFSIVDANSEELEFWQRTLSYHKQKPDDLDQALAILEKHNAIWRTFDLAREYGRRAKSAMKAAPDHPLKQHMINLVDFSINRQS
jgi:octaprenyl-diphosphate synthase